MSDEDPRLTELDIECITITCDGEGNVVYDARGMSMERSLFLLQSTQHMMLTDFWYADDDEG